MIGLFLINQKGYVVLKRLIENQLMTNVSFVVSYEEQHVEEKYYFMIKQLCHDNDIHFIERRKFDFEQVDSTIDYIIAVGWQYLVPTEKLDKKSIKMIILHDSLLPKYRGFAPTSTAIINGEKEVGVSALYANDDMDAGDIILQSKMTIGDDEYISEVIERQSGIYYEMVEKLLIMIESNSITSYKQDESQVTYSIWRDEADCKIDWNKSSVDIYRVIRAVGNPYCGAYSFMDGKKIKIVRAELADEMNFEIRNPGKIWSIKDGIPTIVCREGMLRILESRWEDGEKVVYSKLRKRFD